ncbi:hypothetical protein DITRI_Ditri13aG0116100 [Diplodiscus trichospermus]
MEMTLVEMLREKDYEPDVWTMNSTIRAFGSSGQIETMEKCYEKFQSAGILPNIKTFNIMLDSYGKTGNYQKMSAVMEYMQKYHYSWTIVTYNVVIDAFGRAGDLKQMEYLFRLMRSERIRPSCVTLCSLVRAYGQAGKAEKIAGVLRFIDNSDVTLDIVFFNCLVDAYGRMGCFAEMKGVLEMMKQKGYKPDKITYRTMIKAYSISGMTSHAKELRGLVESATGAPLGMPKPDFRQPEYYSPVKLEIKLKIVSLVANAEFRYGDDAWGCLMASFEVDSSKFQVVPITVIDAFGRAGDLKQMEYLFRLMRSERIKPIAGVLRFIENSDVTLDIVFFNCLVDAYGRMGCFAEMKGKLKIVEFRYGDDAKSCANDMETMLRVVLMAFFDVDSSKLPAVAADYLLHEIPWEHKTLFQMKKSLKEFHEKEHYLRHYMMDPAAAGRKTDP